MFSSPSTFRTPLLPPFALFGQREEKDPHLSCCILLPRSSCQLPVSLANLLLTSFILMQAPVTSINLAFFLFGLVSQFHILFSGYVTCFAQDPCVAYRRVPLSFTVTYGTSVLDPRISCFINFIMNPPYAPSLSFTLSPFRVFAFHHPLLHSNE